MFTSKSEDEKHDTAVTVLFQSQGLGVVGRFLRSPISEQQPIWNPGALEPCNLLLGCKAGLMADYWLMVISL